MPVVFSTIELSSRSHVELMDITSRVEKVVHSSKIKNGLVLVYSQHTTSAIRVNESEKNLLKDVEVFLSSLAPSGKKYGHDRDPVDGRKNAHSHLKSWILSSSETVPLQGGKLLLGNWQRIFFVELDGPRDSRKVIVEVVGETK